MKVIISVFLCFAVLTIIFVGYEHVNTDTETLTETRSNYHDEKYGYTISYPSYLNTQIKEVRETHAGNNDELILSGGVSITNDDGYGVINVDIFKNSAFSSLDEWLAEEEKLFNDHRPIVEKNILIDGEYEAIVTRVQSDNEKVPSSQKETVLIKDDLLFKVRTRFSDEDEHFKVLNSFTFQ